MRRLTIWCCRLGIAGILSAASAPCEAAERPSFPRVASVGKQQLVLNGQGLCEWGWFKLDLYWAALYLPKRTQKVKEIVGAREPKSLQLRFVRALSREQLIKAWTTSVKLNAGKRLPRFAERLEQLNAMMTDVKVGDSMVFNYVPGSGLRVFIGDRKRGVIPGDDFARLFFTLYLGDYTPDKNMRRKLLGT